MANITITPHIENKQLLVEGIFDAPLSRVWEAWADPEQLAKWWGPHGWETTIKTFEFRPGGVWHYCMKCVDEKQGEFFGQESWGLATFQEIEDQQRIMYKDQFSDETGNPNTEMPTMIITLEFSEQNGKTRLVSTGQFESAEELEHLSNMGMVQGLTETWERLDELVKE